ncbi:MAG: hypothetical protein LAO51_15340 [Acidobacteriia bacterium]|nr:hypothetical protein [Terriglobia bacterium]
MDRRGRARQPGVGLSSNPILGLIVAGAAALAGLRPAFGANGETRFFVEVRLGRPEGVADLASAGFDVAGVNRKEMTAGVVATAEELERLSASGWRFDVRESEGSWTALSALQDYTDPEELSLFMEQIQAGYPGLAKKVVLKAALFEGQVLYAMKITKDVAQENERPSFILDAQHHAREVMTTEIARDLIDYLTSRYATDASVRRLVDNVNIWVVGSVNPDGAAYVYQGWTMWRKNRHPSCAVDLNRNYPFNWGSCNGSSSACADETTRGDAPGSEPETQGMIQLTNDVRPFFTLSYHSYGEYLMYSYGCGDPDEKVAMDEVAQGLNAILENDDGQTGQWLTGPLWSTIYVVDGTSLDTQYGTYGAYAYEIEVNTWFQPNYNKWRDVTVLRQRVAWCYFLDRTLDGPQVRGKVTDASTGLPVAAEIDVQEVAFTHGEAPRKADAKGLYYRLARSGQTYHLAYSQPGYCPETRSVAVGTGPATVNIALLPSASPANVVAAGNGANRIDVSWNEAPWAVEYHVYRTLVRRGPYDLVGTVAAPSTSFVDAPVSGGATWYYVVRSYVGCESPPSAEIAASTGGACTLGPGFSGLRAASDAVSSTCSVSLSWPAASARCGGLVTYRVHRSTTSPFAPSPANTVASGLTATTFTDHDALLSGVTYHYLVRALDSASGAHDGNTVTLPATPTGPSGGGVCISGTAANPKEASPGDSQMTLGRDSTGTGLDIDYLPACGALDHAVYWGTSPFSGAVSWTASACGLGTTGRTTFDPGTPGPGGFFYFVLVGQDGAEEGSFGQGRGPSGPVERPEAILVGACDRPQSLAGDCP